MRIINGDYNDPGIGEPVEPNPGGSGGTTNPGGSGGTTNPGGSSGGSAVLGTPIFDLTFNKHEDTSILRIMAYAGLASPDDLQFAAYITVDGVVRQAIPVNLVLDNQQSAARVPLTLPAFINNVAAGAHRIVFSILNREPDGTLEVGAGATIEITELKRAAL